MFSMYSISSQLKLIILKLKKKIKDEQKKVVNYISYISNALLRYENNKRNRFSE